MNWVYEGQIFNLTEKSRFKRLKHLSHKECCHPPQRDIWRHLVTLFPSSLLWRDINIRLNNVSHIIGMNPNILECYYLQY
jgi:hypothetical protein